MVRYSRREKVGELLSQVGELLSQAYVPQILSDPFLNLHREYDTCGSMYVSTLCHAC